MKRLVDESTDELTRSLLRAGIEHRPPAANKRHVVVALGAGGVLGMFSSKALAWLGTTAGKVTATGVAVGVAAGVVARPWEPPSRDGSERGALSAAPSGVDPSDVATPAASSGTEPPSAGVAEPAGGQPGGAPSSAGELGAPGAAEADVGEAASGGERRRSRSARAVKRRPRGARASRPAAAEPAPEASAASSPEEREASARLAAEVRLVDEMHAAARRGDDAALVGAIERYRASFPDGQLTSEVDEFAARLKPSDPR